MASASCRGSIASSSQGLCRGSPYLPAYASCRAAGGRLSTKRYSAQQQRQPTTLQEPTLNRRDTLALLAASVALLQADPAHAVQGLTAGRIPGVSKEADSNGFYTYTRPEGKSGGHGVGWSEIPQYSFRVPAGWDETPVSIADLGGTEIDLRFTNREQGDVAVVVAPVLRFLDVGFGANLNIKEVGEPDRLISGFAPELFGKPLDEGDVLSTTITSKDGQMYYNWQVKPNNLVTATAVKSRVFIMTVVSKPRQWKKHSSNLQAIADSFVVPGGKL